jgi:ribosomal protein S18 acetylase RimI-like enzyme
MEEVRYRAVWQATDTKIQVEAMKLWSDNGLLPANANPAARAAQLCVLADRGGEVVGLSTVQIRPFGALKGRFAVFRCAVAPDHRRQGVATQLAVRSRQALEAWSLANPDQDIQGMACVVRGAELAQKQSQPLWPLSGFGLIGFDSAGNQVRVAWFDHSLV